MAESTRTLEDDDARLRERAYLIRRSEEHAQRADNAHENATAGIHLRLSRLYRDRADDI